MHPQLIHNTAFNSTSGGVTTDHIQQYLDENKALILTILDSQTTGNFTECAENQSRLQHNLMYLAAIADSQPKPSSIHLQQQHMVTQSQISLPQQPAFPLMQQQHALQSQLGIGYAGIHTPRSGSTLEGQGSAALPDFSQSIFGEASQGTPKAASCSAAKENRCITSAEDGDNPQKKSKHSRAAT